MRSSATAVSFRALTAVVAASAILFGAVPAAASASQPAAASGPALVVSDTMDRRVSAGLGDAPVGGAYRLSDPRAFAVSGGTAQATLRVPGTSVTASPAVVSAEDVSQSVVFTVPQLPAFGRGVYLNLQSRTTAAGRYHVQVVVDAKGAALLEVLRVNGRTQTVLARTTQVPRVSAGSPLTVQTSVRGTAPVAIDASVSVAGVVARVSAIDASSSRQAGAGGVGVGAYLSSSSPAQAIVFDDYRVTTTAAAATPGAPATPTAAPTPTATPTPTQTATPTPTPAPTPTSAPPASVPATTDGAPAWDVSGTRRVRGAAPLGTVAPPAPAGAIFVDSRARAGGSGTAAAPLSTVQGAVDRAAAGAVIVVRGGTYNESVTVPAGKGVTIQSAPGEQVWLDGSRLVTGWKNADGAWYVDGWTSDFDSSPTFTRGAADGTASGWQWLNSAHPLAAHPDQVWIDGAALAQVGSRAALAPGAFYVDAAARRLYIGSAPDGHQVRASVLAKALSVRGEGTIVRDIGIRRYATSVWMMGTVTIEAPRAVLDNVVVYDNATTGVFVGASDATLHGVTVARNGLMGIGANLADRLRVDDVLAVENNAEHFNQAPVSGGIKIAKSRGVDITDSAFLRNDGPGIWTDQSVYDLTVASSDLVGNLGHGAFIELTQKVDVVDDLVVGNGGNGLKINNTGDVLIWNNTIVGGNRTVNIVQDPRDAADPAVPGHDPRRPFPDPTMPWLIRDISIGNNVIAGSSGTCTLCVEDYSHRYAASDLNIRSDGNVFQRNTASPAGAPQPAWLVVWSRGAANVNPFVFTSLDAYRAATGQDLHSLAIDGRPVTAADGALLGDVPVNGLAQARPARAAALWTGASNGVGARMP